MATMNKQNVLNCDIFEWYKIFHDITFKSTFIPLTEDFIEFLLKGKFVLSEKQTVSHNGFHSSEGSDSEVDWSTDETETLNEVSFPELEAEVLRCIDELGGTVFPKLNWSSPRDAAWIALDKTLKCSSWNDILLLLKSSDFIIHDLTEPFGNCADTSEDDIRQVQFRLALRQWKNLRPENEFRCFVKDSQLIAISQRQELYHLTCKDDRDAIVTDIRQFFDAHIQNRYPDVSYVFDVYREPRNSTANRVRLVDFNPFSSVTDSLLFNWEELNSIDPHSTDETLPCYRYYDNKEITPHSLNYYTMPVDFVHLLRGEDLNKLQDLISGKCMTADDSSDDDDGDTRHPV